MMKSILLIRHAQSANNALPESERVPDPGLTSLGERQAERLAERLERYPSKIAELYCSPFKRSLDTTLPISRRLNLRPIIRADIYEQGGCYSGYEPGQKLGEPGMSCTLLQQLYPDWMVDPLIGPDGWNVGREYETEEAVKERARSVRDWLSHTWEPSTPDALAALVIHADFKRVLIAAMMGSDRWPDSHLPIWNTSISLLHYASTHWELHTWNNTDHLPSAMRT